MIRMSTQLIEEIAGIIGIVDIMGIASSSPWIRRRRDCSITLPTQRSGVRSIIPHDIIWKSAQNF
jgi:hypothetical protein